MCGGAPVAVRCDHVGPRMSIVAAPRPCVRREEVLSEMPCTWVEYRRRQSESAKRLGIDAASSCTTNGEKSRVSSGYPAQHTPEVRKL